MEDCRWINHNASKLLWWILMSCSKILERQKYFLFHQSIFETIIFLYPNLLAPGVVGSKELWLSEWWKADFIHSCSTNRCRKEETQTWLLILCSWWISQYYSKPAWTDSGIDWEFGNSRYKLLYTEWINNKVQLYSTENYIQFPVIDQVEKNMKENAYICITESLCFIEINTTL